MAFGGGLRIALWSISAGFLDALALGLRGGEIGSDHLEHGLLGRGEGDGDTARLDIERADHLITIQEGNADTVS